MEKNPWHFWQGFVDNSAQTGAISLPCFAQLLAQKLKKNQLLGSSIVMFDVDRFASLNGRYGSARGQQLLQELTAVLVSYLHADEPFARVEDKFLLLIPNAGDALTSLQQGLAQAVQSMRLEKYVGEVRFSFGVYEIKNAKEAAADIIEKVQVAHKTAGKHPHKTVVFYDEALVQAIAQENYYNEHLLPGLAQHEFKVYLQRQVVLRDENALRAKALVRWALPNGRLVYPDSFIPQFEKNGLMPHLDFYMLGRVCEYLQQLREEGKHELVISVNISAITLLQPDFVDRTLAIVRQYEVPSHSLVLEIQKSFLIEDEKAAMEKLHVLRQNGLQLAAEIVTAGRSNLCLLAELPARYLKLDRKLLRAVDASPNVVQVLSGVIEMAHKLSAEVICEGVEHAADLELLQSLGCDIAQGYHLMKAVPKEEFFHLLGR